jgi:hypothetical protein
MAKAKEPKAPKRVPFNAEPNEIYLILAKILEAKRDGKSLADRDQYNPQVGTHHLEGILQFNVDYTVGEDTTTMRSYGVPMDTVLMLAFLYAGAFRPQLLRAACVVKEIRTAELEERRVRSIRFTYDGGVVRVSAMQVAREATRLGLRLIGVYPVFADDPAECERRETAAQIMADCLTSIKVSRPYAGPINPEQVTLNVLGAMEAAA